MNLYLVLALAFGAISGAAAAPAARPLVENVVAESGVCSARQVVPAALDGPSRTQRSGLPTRYAQRATRHADAPLTGAATPRAPAHNC